MIISRYGTNLIRIKPEHLELIRYWRNSDKIRRVMEFTDFITEKMQHNWFKELHPLNDFYFVIEYKGVLVGLIHIAKIDWQNRKAQSGLFIWEENFLGSPVPIMASLNLLDTFFNVFVINQIEAKVKHDNFVALTYNKFLGFEENGTANNKDFIKVSLYKEKYYSIENDIKSYLDQPNNIIQINDISQVLQELNASNQNINTDVKDIEILS